NICNKPAVRSFDCILVAHLIEDEGDHTFKKQQAYITQLREKNLKVTQLFHENKVFYGIRAPEEVFEKYKYLLKVSDSCNSVCKEKDYVPDTIREYFGEKVALYFLWLGWYTRLLIPAAIIGVIVFLYGLAFFNTNPLIKEVCESNITMCPACDIRCKAWKLSDTCAYAKVRERYNIMDSINQAATFYGGVLL
ncbi:hypothetical protein NFI96_032664, partial [Prochilodus magdalenae]